MEPVIAFVDADDSNASKRESVADLVSAIAGSGLIESNGTLNLTAGHQIEIFGNRIQIGNFAVSNTGLAGGSGGNVNVSLNNLPEANSINVANDYFAFVDVDNGNTTNKESIADLSRMSILW